MPPADRRPKCVACFAIRRVDRFLRRRRRDQQQTPFIAHSAKIIWLAGAGTAIRRRRQYHHRTGYPGDDADDGGGGGGAAPGAMAGGGTGGGETNGFGATPGANSPGTTNTSESSSPQLPAWFVELMDESVASGNGAQVPLFVWKNTYKLADFSQYDLNGDGFITQEEMTKWVRINGVQAPEPELLHPPAPPVIPQNIEPVAPLPPPVEIDTEALAAAAAAIKAYDEQDSRKRFAELKAYNQNFPDQARLLVGLSLHCRSHVECCSSIAWRRSGSRSAE